VEVVASLSQGHTAAAQCGLFTYKSVPVIFEPPCIIIDKKCVLSETVYFTFYVDASRSQWPRGLRRRSLAAHLLRLCVRIPPRAWMFVCCECCVLSGRGLYDGLIIRSEESYRLWRVVVCDQETSQARRLKPARGL